MNNLLTPCRRAIKSDKLSLAEIFSNNTAPSGSSEKLMKHLTLRGQIYNSQHLEELHFNTTRSPTTVLSIKMCPDFPLEKITQQILFFPVQKERTQFTPSGAV